MSSATEFVPASATGAISSPNPNPVSARCSVIHGSPTSSPHPLISLNPNAANSSPATAGALQSTRWHSSPPKTAPAGSAAVIRISISPPSSGVSPNTVFAISGTVTIPTISAAPTGRCATFAAASARARNIARGSSGSSALICRHANSPNATIASPHHPAAAASGSPIRDAPSVSAARLAATSPPPMKSTRALYRGDCGSSHNAIPTTIAHSGRLSQNTHSHAKNLVTIPPQSGPTTPPASAAAPTSPSATPRRSRGNRSPAIAMDIGTSAPAPSAWNTRSPISHSKLGASATPADPAANAASAPTNRLRCPYMSDSRPISGIAATYPSKYPLIAHDALSISVIGVPKSAITRGSTVTITVWSSAATNTPANTAASATYGDAARRPPKPPPFTKRVKPIGILYPTTRQPSDYATMTLRTNRLL